MQGEALGAVKANARISGEALPLVLAAGRGAADMTRYSAMYALSHFIDAGVRVEPRDAFSLMDPILPEDDSSLHEARLDLLARLGRDSEAASERLTLLLRMEDPSIRRWAEELLASRSKAVDPRDQPRRAQPGRSRVFKS